MIRLKIKEIAMARGISQNKLARLADLDNNSVRRIYQNAFTNVTTETLNKIAIALNVDISLLVENDPPLPKTLEEN